ncbi:hypothetical protein GGR58DRAFT_483468 [Xylaria digitata]|nr:hypothetical protein GGR58DRAFT_483468 [Xylaria digitata]
MPHSSLIIRNADSRLGDRTQVLIQCSRCGARRMDTSPSYLKATGEYIYRQTGCKECPLSLYDKRKKRKTATTTHVPVDRNMPYLAYDTAWWQIRKGRWQFEAGLKELFKCA